MIAAQLLAYYFTELKDDQVKKVSGFCTVILAWTEWTSVKKEAGVGLEVVLVETIEFLDIFRTILKDDETTDL